MWPQTIEYLFIPDASLADFSIEISDIETSQQQDVISFWPASCHDPSTVTDQSQTV